MPRNMMCCGCVADSLDEVNGPYCSLHYPSELAKTVLPDDLTKRVAVCIMCGKKIPSKVAVLDFEFRPDLSHDYYNCGCKG